MATYAVNQDAVAHAPRADRQEAVRRSTATGARCSPTPAAQNAYLEKHSWEEYAAWHLGLTEGANDETKARYAFVYGDLRRVHRTGLIACVYRAAEWRHKKVELAAHDLLQHLDRAPGSTDVPPERASVKPGPPAGSRPPPRSRGRDPGRARP